MAQNSTPSNDSTTIKVFFELPYRRFAIGIGLSIIAALISRYYLGFEIRDSIALAAAGFVATTLWYNAVNLNFNANASSNKLAFDKKVVAVNLMSEWHKEFCDKAILCRGFIDDHYAQRNGSDNLVIKIDAKDTGIRSSLVPILNYFEKISIAVKEGVADEEIIKDYFGDIFKKYYESYFPFIKSRREGPGGLPSAFENFCTVSLSYGAKRQQ